MKILFSGALFMMGLLGSTKWFELLPDTEQSPAAEEAYFAECNLIDNHFQDTYQLVLIVEENGHSEIIVLVKDAEALCKKDDLLTLLCKVMEGNTDTNLSESHIYNQAITVLHAKHCNVHYYIRLPRKLLILAE